MGASVMFVSVAFALSLACIPHQSALDYFQSRWNETVAYFGVTNNGLVLETLVNRETGTWTMLLIRPDKLACFLASGEGWRELVTPLGEDDA